MANASKKNMGAGAQGKGSGSGAATELPRDLVGENEILSNRDKSQHNEQRGLDSKQVRNEQRQDHPANRAQPQASDAQRNERGEMSERSGPALGERGEAERRSEGPEPAHPSPQQKSGAGPALARHSKDA